MAARKRVADAEESERAADQALIRARASVREAREEVRRLEREASEEYVPSIRTFEVAGLTLS